MKKQFLVKAIVAFSIVLLVSGIGLASNLLPQYTDANNDLVADTPTNPQDWLDPDTLIFSYTPVEDPATYRDAWSDFLDYLSEKTGKPVQFYTVENYAAQLEALRAGRLHIAGVNTGSVPMAVNVAGFVPFAIMADDDGSFGYEMEVIVHKESDIMSLEDLYGRQLALVSPTSNSGYKAPTSILKGQFDMEEDVHYFPVFSGRHDNSILGVYNKDYEAAAVSNSTFGSLASQGIVDFNEIRTIYKSETFPTTGYGYVYNLKPELQEQIIDAFLTFDWTGTSLETAFGVGSEGGTQFVPITYLDNWAVIRTIDEASGVVYR